METIRLSNSDYTVSRIVMGCEPLGGSDWGEVDSELAMHAASESLLQGINCFDTADIYGLGRSEELLSTALGTFRSRVVIISKFGLRWKLSVGESRAQIFRDASAGWCVQALEQSLRRLKLARIPVYLVHWPDTSASLTETIEVLESLRVAGKIGCLGVSNFSAEQIREAHRIAPLSIVEVPYSLLDRRAERDILPLCRELGLSVLAYGPLGQGLLTGKYGPGHEFGANDRRRRLPHFQADLWPHSLRTIERLRQTASLYGKSPAQVAIRWVIDNPAVSAAIVGAKSPNQIAESAAASGWSLLPQDYQYLASEDIRDEIPRGKVRMPIQNAATI